MSGRNDGGDKTEKPTDKRLQDARRKGDVPKSRDVTGTAGLAAWLAIGAAVLEHATGRIVVLFDALFATIGRGWAHDGFVAVARAIGGQAADAALMLVVALLVPVAMVGLLVEFLQTGPVLAMERLSPSLEGMNPVEGVKRMFSIDNLVEVVKSVAKTALLLAAGWIVVSAALPQLVGLARAPVSAVGAIGVAMWTLTVKLFASAVGLFAFVSLLDWGWQRYSYLRKHRMSIADIKQEMKDSQGDPHVRQQRKRAQKEWEHRNVTQAARTASALIVNPTHVAIAISYDPETSPIPTVSAKGQDEVAREMREAAMEAGVPIVRNIALARDLLARAEEGETVPADLFEVIAQVILWAREVRAEVDSARRGEQDAADRPRAKRRVAAPGEDLTRYQEP